MSQVLEARPYTAWQLLKAYWQSDQRKIAYIFFVSVIILSLVLIGLDVTFTNWYNYFYNALQDYDKRSTLDLLVVFTFLAAIYIVFAVYRFYLQQFLGLRWRRWLTDQFLNRWMEHKSYYYLENFDEYTDNPDQRIQEDIGSLVNSSLALIVGLLSSIATFFAFIYILWELSGLLHIRIYGHILHIHGYLVWVAIIYAMVGTLLTFKIGRPLVELNFEQQRREADFRFAAIDLRTHSENVALYRGEHHQKNILQRTFNRVLENWYAIILRQKLLMWFTAGYNQVSVLVPLVVALPNYFNKVFKLGGLIQSLAAFQRIQDALSFLVNSYTAIAEWRAVMKRLLTFLNHVYDVEQKVSAENKFSFSKNTDNKITVHNLLINTPDGTNLLKNINEELVHGQNYLIKGDSGIGKSTFLRAIAGIWPYGSGNISLPEKKNVMFLPQKSYMPLGTLQEALLFPDNITSLSETELIELLNACDLPALTTQLHQATHWSEHLSPGELQRIAFIRVLIHKPDWVFLDESTSALDLRHEKHLYELLRKRLPYCSIVSVGHRPSIENYHDNKIELEQYKVQ
jgi:putative ATP-binding cassette transporter